MEATSIIGSILPYLWGAVALAAVFALVQIGRTASVAARRLEQVVDRLDPILEKADVSVDALNAELLRIDAIISDVEEISAAAASATRAVESVTNAPIEIATNFADRLRRRFKQYRSDSDGCGEERFVEASVRPLEPAAVESVEDDRPA